MTYLAPLLPFAAGWLLLLSTQTLSTMGLVNGLAQLLLFVAVVNIPIWRTGRISYVDVGWPLGVAIIGLVALLMGEGYAPRVWGIGAVYLFIGLRMGIGAINLWRRGKLAVEFPRYQYQKRRWERDGKSNVSLAMQIEASTQGLANASFLALPAFVIAVNPTPIVSALEVVGLVLWAAAFAMESLADAQKAAFIRQAKQEGRRDAVCNVGLWRYSRHPNYFAEWMVWNGLIIASIPSWWVLRAVEPAWAWALVGLGLLFISRIMHTTLVYYSGAVPSEFYSSQKRPGYAEYQEQTNRFFPGPVRKRLG
ncbi:MAG: DUF1295 domain-containing protein [Myxococcota bacterium]